MVIKKETLLQKTTVDKKVADIQKTLNALRADGEDKINALNIENRAISKNKKLDQLTKRTLIEKNKELIKAAIEVKKQNALEVRKAIVEIKKILGREYSLYLRNLKMEAGTGRIEAKKAFAQAGIDESNAHRERMENLTNDRISKLTALQTNEKIAALKEAHVEGVRAVNEKYAGSDDKVAYKKELSDVHLKFRSDRHELIKARRDLAAEQALILKNEKLAFKSKTYENKSNLKRALSQIKDELHGAKRHRAHILTAAENGAFDFVEYFAQKFENYIYHFSLRDFLLKNGLYIIIIIVFIVCIIAAPLMGRQQLLTLPNILAILEQSSTRMFLALGVAGLILLGGTDLSIGRMVGLGAVLTVVVLHPGPNIIQFFELGNWDFNAIPMAIRVIMALLLSVIFCTLFSAFAGYFTANFKMHPFISTLGTQLIIYGLLVFATKGTNSGFIDTSIKSALAGRIGDFPILIIYAVVIIAVVWFVWNKTKFGKNMYAVGGNAEAANVSGISVFWTTLGVFIMAGVLYGLGSFFEGLRLGAASSGTGTGWELDAIAACVVGGISFSGGIGKVKGAVIGVLIFTALTYALSFLGIDTNLQFVLKGVIIVSAVTLDSIKYIKKT